MKELTVVLPCLNEENTIGICIQKCLKAFLELNINGEVLVSDNGSSDKSIEIAQKLGARICFAKEKGYGNTLINGIKNCCSKYVLMADCDDTYDLSEIPKLYNEIDETTDMVIGSRLKGNIQKGAMPFLHRYLGTPVLTFILNVLYKTKISDSQCGMRLIRKSCLDKLELKAPGFEFASELLVLFAKNGFKIKEVPISLNCNKDRSHPPYLNTWKDGFRHLKYLILNFELF